MNAALEAQAPDLLVNAAAYTAVDKAESEPAMARAINTDAVRVLARYARDHGILLVHYSTDYVFDGAQDTIPARRRDESAQRLRRHQARRRKRHPRQRLPRLILRTSWVHSAHGGNFVKTILRLARERDALNIVADQHGAPTSAELIADVTAHAIAASQRGALPHGIHHLTAQGETTWHGLARYVVSRALRQASRCAPAPAPSTPSRLRTTRCRPRPGVPALIPAA